MFHAGILKKASGSNYESPHIDVLVFLLQLCLNAGLAWRFSSYLTKDMLKVI